MGTGGRSGKPKSVADPGWISVLVPSRGRPQLLGRFLDSIDATVIDAKRVDVWVYGDPDDPETAEAVRARGGRVRCHVIPGGNASTNGRVFNALWEQSTNAGLYMFANDKMQFLTPGWDAIARRAFDAHPDRLMFAWCRDNFHRNFGGVGFLSAEWVNLVGGVFTEYFPFWYDDTWLNDVSRMIGRWVPLPVRMRIDIGTTHHLYNIAFWARFYDAVEDERRAEAERLICAIHHDDPSDLDRAIERMRAFVIPTQEERLSGLILAERDRSSRLQDASVRPPPESRAIQGERAAARRLREKLAEAAAAGRDADVQRIESALANTTEAGDQLEVELRSAHKSAEWPRVFRLLREYLLRFPNSPAPYVAAAELLVDQGMSAQARTIVEAAGALFPGDPRIRAMVARV